MVSSNWEEEFDNTFADLETMQNPDGTWTILKVPKDVPALKVFIRTQIEKCEEAEFHESRAKVMVRHARQEERSRVLQLIEPYIENCKKALAEGGMSQFGSASGSMMAKSALEAFEALRNKLTDTNGTSKDS